MKDYWLSNYYGVVTERDTFKELLASKRAYAHLTHEMDRPYPQNSNMEGRGLTDEELEMWEEL
jgi:hypothetical protein